jgi:hypothetical protein
MTNRRQSSKTLICLRKPSRFVSMLASLFVAVLSVSVYAQDVPVSVEPSAPPALTPEPIQPTETPAAQPSTIQDILNIDLQNPDAQSGTATTEQGAIPANPPQAGATDIEMENLVFKAGAGNEKKKSISSLFYTESQFNTLNEAIKRRNYSAVTEEGDVTYSEPSDGMEEGDEERVKPANREVYLSGLVFVHEKDWTVWLNGMRVKPDAIPDEIKDIKVYKTHIDIKWFDDYNNKIYPIRLKPHQRFNVDTHVFLPG